MDQRYKKNISVLLAILVGVGIVFFALKRGYVHGVPQTNFPESGEWENSLSVIPQASSSVATNPSWGNWGTSSTTNTADIVTQELLFNYVRAQKDMATTTMSDAEVQMMAQELAGKITLPQAKQYTEKDIAVLDGDSSIVATTYYEALNSALRNFALSQTKSDLEIVFTPPKKGDEAKRIAEIKQNIAHYDTLIKNLLTAKVPRHLAIPHLHLVQQYANIQANIIPMSEIFYDPLKGIKALSKYKESVAGLTAIEKEFEDIINKVQ